MAKKILIPLDMNGVKVRSLESLKENFDLEKVTAYFVDGTLLRWLESRYYEEEAERVRNLSKDDANLSKKLCEVFGVEYKGEVIDVEDTARRHEVLKKLKQLTTDEEIISHVAQVAFTQEDLAYLLNADEKTIYLCGKNSEKFFIPASFENRKYIGILGKPEIKVNIKTFEELKARGITFENVDLPKNLLTPSAPAKPTPPPEPSAPKEVFQGRARIQGKSCSLNGYTVAVMIEGKIDFYSKIRVLEDGKEIYRGSVRDLRALSGRNIPNVYRTDDFYGNSFLIQFDKILSVKTGAIIQAYGVE